MRRTVEFLVILSTLAAIVSTFFLYHSYTFSPKMTANIIQSDETFLNNPNTPIETIDTKVATSTASTTAPEATDTNLNAKATPTKQEILIEQLPITQAEIEVLTTKIHSLTNLSRSQNNLSSYTYDPTLSEIAKKRSEEMIVKNYFSHTSPTGCGVSCLIKQSGYQTLSWGENLALSNTYHAYTLTELAQTFMADWLKSSKHRDNVLSNKFTNQGIGMASEGDKIVITVVFSAK